jgi:hypothetical protein
MYRCADERCDRDALKLERHIHIHDVGCPHKGTDGYAPQLECNRDLNGWRDINLAEQ